MANRAIRYSDAFKKQVVSELESGKIASQFQARERGRGRNRSRTG